MICVDASVAAKWILDEEWSEEALALYSTSIRAGMPIVAPVLMPIEVTNILRKRLRAPDGPSLEGATVLLNDFLALQFTVQDPSGLHQRALAIANDLSLPAVYDAHYLAMSEILGCQLWTDDQRLLRRIGQELSYVKWIGDFRNP